MSQAESRKVAVVDDDRAVRESLRFLLEVLGYAVETFESAAEFLMADIQEMACLILDHHMPHMTGLRLAERLRGDGICLPILLITGSPTPDLIVRASQLGIEQVLDKPPSENELIEFIEGSSAR